VIVSSTLQQSGEAVIQIRDTDVGMSDKEIEPAMQPFGQVAIARETRSEASGLRLTLTHALVGPNGRVRDREHTRTGHLGENHLPKLTRPRLND
jgi:hypothetical protein